MQVITLHQRQVSNQIFGHSTPATVNHETHSTKAQKVK